MVWLIAWAVLAVIAAGIAKAKDRSVALWLLYGVVLAPIALIHSLLVRTDEIHYEPIPVPSFAGTRAPFSVADELAKLAELQERGHITKDEYLTEKAKLLAEAPMPSMSAPIEPFVMPSAAPSAKTSNAPSAAPAPSAA